jgi:uncharacterized protein (UPF0333 family)
LRSILTNNKPIANNQKGQAMVEYILLLLTIIFISIAFMQVSHRGLGEYWLAFAKVIIEDPAIALRFIGE